MDDKIDYVREWMTMVDYAREWITMFEYGSTCLTKGSHI
jgi:hypothetical protein